MYRARTQAGHSRELRPGEGTACVLLSFILSVTALGPAAAQQTDACSEMLTEAQAAYLDQRFTEAIQQIDECLESGRPADLVATYRLMALAYIRLDQLGDARLAIVQLLNAAPDYVPDPVADPPDYTVLVEVVRRQFEPQPPEPVRTRSWFRSNAGWLLSGAAAVSGGVLAAILLGGGSSGGSSGGSTLPPPPAVPH